jgi:protein SCO1/2
MHRATMALMATLICAVPIATAGTPPQGTLPSLVRVYLNPDPRPIADFELTDHTGQKRSFSSLRGQPALVFFGFTYCPDVCPATMMQMKSLHEARGGALKAAKIVMVSVDGERDTPAAMKAFLAPLSPDFLGLTGDPKVTARIAAQFSAVFFKEPPGEDGSYNVMHSPQVFIVDKLGRPRASFVDASIENMAAITAILLQEAG